MLNITMICIIMITIAPCRLQPEKTLLSSELSPSSIRGHFPSPQKISGKFSKSEPPATALIYALPPQPIFRSRINAVIASPDIVRVSAVIGFGYI